ncbi:MAG TPA: PAS domain S-box protein, partial [Thermodesulfovibrionales bacterium]|nr:PAS domain S-box protein [Thermodesulfovibrionales bacterium]
MRSKEREGNDLMSLRSRLTVFAIGFLLVVAVSVSVSFLIFERLSGNFEMMKRSVEEHELHRGLRVSIIMYVNIPDRWAITGDPRLKAQYRERLAEVYKSFGNLSAFTKEGNIISAIGKDFEEMKRHADAIMSFENPVGNAAVSREAFMLHNVSETLIAELDALYLNSLRALSARITQAEGVKSEMKYYFTALFIVSSLTLLLLVLFMRKMIAVPFNDILTATSRITSGEIGYRIASKRSDEFGVIANRFDQMVDELQKASEENAELYLSARDQLQKARAMHELAKAITSTLDLNALLRNIAENATESFRAKGCVIRLREDDKLIVRASFGISKEVEDLMTLSLGEGLPGKVAAEGRPILVEDISKLPAEWGIPYLDARSVLNVPLKVREEVIGTWALYDKIGAGGEVVSFSADDLVMAEGFASLSAIAIEKAKLFEQELKKEEEALEAKKRLDVLFESVQGGIITLARDYSILSANWHIETWIGKPADEIIGKNCLELFHENKGICPHCVAQVTFETGEINTITQMSGLNYAELTSYPIRDEQGGVSESAVFVLDITDRVLYQEEMIALYREVMQTKEYLESLIENSADAIVTSDLHGVITSWNQGAERIYGYTEEEAMGKYLPFVPEFLRETEKDYTERVNNGEVMKVIETLRQKKDGALIEVSLTLSPIKDASGAIIGASGISRDISGKKAVEKELIRRNQELSRLFFIISAMRSTLDLNRLLRMILTAVTMGDGLGFNRAVLFLVDEEKGALKGAMGVGPSSYEEAGKVWERLSQEKKTLADVMQDIEEGILDGDTFLDRLSTGIEIPLDADSVLALSVKEKQSFNVADARHEHLSDAVLIQQLGTEAYAVVPLISRDKVIGVLFVDNFFNKKTITEEDMRFLTAFSNQMAAAIEGAKLFAQVSLAEAELENIFRSISDMVYFTDMDYTIRKANKAVAARTGMTESTIIGKKCYEVFHGTNEPWQDCPHHRTVEHKKALIEEVSDPRTGETFLSSTSPLFDLAGKFLGTVHIVRDISELKQIRERLATSERMAALGEVAAKVAHEIRNPLVSIGGFAQRLEHKLDGNLREYATIIAREVKRLEDILRDILGFVREVRLSLTHVNINALLRDVIALVETEITNEGIAIETAFSEVTDVLLDMDRMREAFLNIVNNAIQAVGNRGRIRIATYSWDGYLVVDIQDTGKGISEKD